MVSHLTMLQSERRESSRVSITPRIVQSQTIGVETDNGSS